MPHAVAQNDLAVITAKGRATRDRIVSAAAALMYEHGVGATSTPAIRDAAQVSSSQIYHYFVDKDALTRAVIAFQAEQVLNGQSPMLIHLDSFQALNAWRDFVVDAARQQDGRGGCPLGSLSGELADEHPWARDALQHGFQAWSDALRNGLLSMIDNQQLRADADADQLALALLTALQGGLLLAQTFQSTEPLTAALDVVIAHIATYKT